jgi:transposase
MSVRDGWMWGVDDAGVSGVEQASREDLLALIGAQARMIEELTARVVELERRLGRNSSNSSQPPSQDGLGKPPPRSMRGRSGRKAGKQPGSPGSALAQVEVPDRLVKHLPSVCGGCAAPLDRAAVADMVARRQVPEARVQVTEHQLFAVACGGCRVVTRAPAPVGVNAPAVYGPNVRAMAAYVAAAHHVPTARIVEILADLTGVQVSVGWVVDAVSRARTAIERSDQAVKDALAGAPVAYFDESVTRIGGRNHWLHTAATSTLTVYHADEHGRSGKSIAAFGILPRFTGIAMHDAYAAYDSYTACTHALCNAHIVREAAGIGEFDPAAAADGWAADLVGLLSDAHRWTRHWSAEGHARLPDFKLQELHERYDRLVGRALAAHPPRTRKQSAARNLGLRLRDRRAEFLRFATDFRVDFSNNTAEQAIRMIKTKTKVSGGFRTLTAHRPSLHYAATSPPSARTATTP